MSVDRTAGRRKNQRAFRPTLDGGLESRLLLSKLPPSVILKHPRAGVAYQAQEPPFRQGTSAHKFPIAKVPRGPAAATEVAHGGQTVIVATPDGSQFEISLTYYNQPTPTGATTSTTGQAPIQNQTPGASSIQPQGAVRAYPMSGGRIGLILDGTTNQTELTISPYAKHQRKGYAHSYSYGMAAETHVLNIGQITVNSGQLAAVEGYHTADLSGPLVVAGTQPVDRIALNALLPGATIQTGSDLNTLDIFQGVNLNSGPGIVIGRDLNLLNVGQDLDLSNGASLIVGRYLATAPQPPKGTATGSNLLSLNQSLAGTGATVTTPTLGTYIQGSINLGTGSSIIVPNGIATGTSLTTDPVTGRTTLSSAVLLVNGAVIAPSFTQIFIPNAAASSIIAPGDFVARAGFLIPGVVPGYVFNGTSPASQGLT